MTNYYFIYSQYECNRVVAAVLIDKRGDIPEIKNQTGDVIKAFIDAQTALVADNCIFYKIESIFGNLAGYFTLQVIREGVVTILQYELRPAHQQFEAQISQEIAIFIQQSLWQYDYL